MGFDKKSEKRIANVVRQVERQPVFDVPDGKKRRSISASPLKVKTVRVVDNGTKIQNTVRVQEYKIEVHDEDGALIKSDDLTADLDVTITSTTNFFYAVNPRRNYLDLNVLYIAYFISGYWMIDNQAVFHEWQQTQFT